ncbi:phospholipase C [Anseongella ginsenosidimutans]|uniref:phospholipase C n=1 Tax=Anseongella ginsenosidimutans TaxID=496056 RepID=A0A4R3KNC2_9SPHI|nr:phospholipase C, phosphocholine-specific [Anseongella ginsenosidimutans]QEC53751.1 phospholipase C, phosphocholine-specific [Anseongella ginsenosidimutans]TCS85991.1 phospholipase C [Anseongella ginsenosidimutans]
MDSRRDFLKKTLLLSGAAGISGIMPASIQRALAINPAEGSSYLDAEHVVILMQENRSFDHCFGTLRGVRGFNDPRFIHLPDNKPVWLQTNKAGDTFGPFHLNMRDTKATWMGDTPHSRSSQVDANNEGKYDKWLDAKEKANYPGVPLTMGYYTRQDLPFNYAMADAFTICDQHFCSAMTSTWPNRLYLWSGTIRGEQSGEATAYIRNEIPYGDAHWKTFPERLEDNGISWKVYQNDITTGGGYQGEERSWLSNFGCNPLEFLSQFNARFAPGYVKGRERLVNSLPEEISALEEKIASMAREDKGWEKAQKDLAAKKNALKAAREELVKWSRENFEKLPRETRNLYEKAFANNAGDADYRSLATLDYEENGVKRSLSVPKGDVLYQFREDAGAGKLPAVSWLVPSQNFSDHPSAPWYGAWYVSEVLDILTKDPELWKKTIFILTYDENDGYFDHIPPFTSPDPENPATGKCPEGMISKGEEYIRLEQELEQGLSKRQARGGPIGLGYRVPMIIASPWSRGGKVCSQVFDHTSPLQFLENFVNRKFGKNIREENISPWRRAICGDLSAAFSRYEKEKSTKLPFLPRDPFIEDIYNAKFKDAPATFKKLSSEEIAKIKANPASSGLLPRQEPGTRPSRPLPYELYADCRQGPDGGIEIEMRAGNNVFGKQSAGAPFKVYAPGNYLSASAERDGGKSYEAARNWDFAVPAGRQLAEQWPFQAFEEGKYHLRIYGPNGFFREFQGTGRDPLSVACDYERHKSRKKGLTGNVELTIKNLSPDKAQTIVISDQAYKSKPLSRELAAGQEIRLALDQEKSYGWYDFTVTSKEYPGFIFRYAGRVETGEEGLSDPAMA